MKTFKELQDEQTERRYKMEDAIMNDLFDNEDSTATVLSALAHFLTEMSKGEIVEGIDDCFALIDNARAASFIGRTTPINRIVALAITDYAKRHAYLEYPPLKEEP